MARILHQFIAGASPGDAITDQALLIKQWLHQWGFSSNIYAEHVDPQLQGVVHPALSYRPSRSETHCIYHHSIGSTLVDRLLESRRRLLLIYHNVTPPHFLAAVDPVRAQRAAAGEQQLAQLRPLTELALGDSPYNEAELRGAGFDHTGVLPICIDETQYQHSPPAELRARHAGHNPLLLFVGRLAPNKRQEDLVKLLYYLRRLRADAHLVLVGGDWMPAYTAWLLEFIKQAGLLDAVTLTGRAAQATMVSYYQLADFYVSMSEHEGFGKPLIESMYLGLPVIAYASTAVPGTLGDAGILFARKDYPALAELLDMLVTRPSLREHLVRQGEERVQAFLPSRVAASFRRFLATAGIDVEEAQ